MTPGIPEPIDIQCATVGKVSLHARSQAVAAAQLELSKKVVRMVRQFNLTQLELQAILNQVSASWLKSAIQQERENG